MAQLTLANRQGCGWRPFLFRIEEQRARATVRMAKHVARYLFGRVVIAAFRRFLEYSDVYPIASIQIDLIRSCIRVRLTKR